MIAFTVVRVSWTSGAVAALADPLDLVDVGGGRHPGAGQRDVATRLRNQMGTRLHPACKHYYNYYYYHNYFYDYYYFY